MSKEYKIIVVGGGHAGVEASRVAEKMGMSVILITNDRNSIGRMSCNPAIGGLAKSRVVREVDTLGGIIAKAADKTAIQYRVLNRKKGPAVQSTRSQNDRKKYEKAVQEFLNKIENIKIIDGIVNEVIIENSEIKGVIISDGEEICSDAVILATGTFLGGKMFIGNDEIHGGRIGESYQSGLSESLREAGLKLLRFKTGTPPRIKRKTINFDRLKEQPGEEKYIPFSMKTEKRLSISEQEKCYITFTNDNTHRIIRSNL
ncbi:tRNA uridine-5-carboxymethylaminomethyl(34) synthesis enzyme MnmG, partial [bacterium]